MTDIRGPTLKTGWGLRGDQIKTHQVPEALTTLHLLAQLQGKGAHPLTSSLNVRKCFFSLSYCCSHPWIQGGSGRRENLLSLGQGISSTPHPPSTANIRYGSFSGEPSWALWRVEQHPLAPSTQCQEHTIVITTEVSRHHSWWRPSGLEESLGKWLLP